MNLERSKHCFWLLQYASNLFDNIYFYHAPFLLIKYPLLTVGSFDTEAYSQKMKQPEIIKSREMEDAAKRKVERFKMRLIINN